MAEKTFDLAIIGAGIVGTMAAYLAGQRRSDWRIVLIDRSLVGHGATQYSAGLDRPYGSTALQKRLSFESAKVYRELKIEMPDLPIHELPLFGVTRKERIVEVIAGFTKDGVRPATELEERQLRYTYADFAISDDQVLLTGCSGSYGFPRLVAEALANRFKERELAECWEGVEIQAVDAGSGGYVLSTSDGRTRLARRVLVATGPWLLNGPGSSVARNAGVRIKKIVTLHIDLRPGAHDPIIFFFDDDAYLLPVYERREWLFSFASQEWDCTPDISRLRITASDRALALSILGCYCPSFAEYCHGGRVFCDAYSRDWMPIITLVPGPADFGVVGACSGFGYRLAPGIAKAALKQFSGFPQ